MSTNPQNDMQDNNPEHDPLNPEPTPDEQEHAPEPEQEHPQEAPEAQATESSELESLRAELTQTKEQMLRVAAEAENTKRRALKEKEDAGKYANARFAKDILSVADNLRRALDSVPQETLEADPQVKNLVDGIQATERELLKSFENNGIRPIDPSGEIFNPNYHEVMFEAPGTGQKPGTVVEVMELGYVLHDRLIRPARVGVAKDEGNNPGQVDTEA